MSGFDDDVLRDMLATRADRVSPNAAGEVMAAVRAEVRGPRQGAAFSVLPVLTGRSPAFGAGWAAAIMVAVLVMVVVATRPASVAAPSSSAGAGATVASLSASPSASAATSASAPAVLTLSSLRQAEKDGSLDGHVLLVDSTLRLATSPLCGADPSSCPPEFALDFVGGVVTRASATAPVVPAVPDASSVPLAGTFVVVPWKGHLLLVGRLQGSLASPVSVSSLGSAYQAPDPGSAIALQAVAGWFIQNGVHSCPALPAGATPCPGPIALTETLPDPAGAVTGPTALVTVASPAPGIDPASVVTTGPFLVRTGTGSRPEVVARYDPSAVTVVATPTVTCDLPSGTKLPSCAKLITFATESLLNLGDLQSIDVRQGAWACPPSKAPCENVPPEQSAVVAVHASGGDWEIGLSFDANGIGLEIMPMPLGSSYPVPSSATVTCDLASGTNLPPCNEAVAQAISALQSVGTIASVEVGLGAHCAPGMTCPTIEPNGVHVIVRAAYGDWIVGLTYDANGRLGAVSADPLPSPEPSPSYVPVSCVGVGYGQVTTLTCEPAVAAALKVVPAGTAIASVEFAYGSAVCPPWVRCVLASLDPNAGYVIVHVAAPGPDLWVGVTADATGVVTAGTPVSYPYTSGSVSPAPTYAVSTASSAPWALCQVTANAPSSAIDCNAAIAAALSVLPAGTTVVSAEFAPGSCPPWARCAAGPDPRGTAHVTVKVASPGPALWVSVALGSNGIVTASAPVPFPAGWSSASPAP